jgi:excisionase family DNA binding protein
MKKDNGSTGWGGGDSDEGAARDLLTVEQAARYLQLSPSSIRSYMRQGKLKGFRIAGLRKVLIPRAELLALLEPARAETPAHASPPHPPAALTPIGPIK